MKIFLIVITLATIRFANAQSADQRDLIEILNVALTDNKLPDELINKSNQKIASWTNASFIVIKSDTTKNLVRLSVLPDSSNHVWILDYEDIFMLDIAYGLVPVRITREDDRLTLDFKTIKYPTVVKTNICHSGQIIAEKNSDTWTIVKSKTMETKCEIDMFGREK